MYDKLFSLTRSPQSSDGLTFDLQRFRAAIKLEQDTSGNYLISSTDDLNTLATYVNAGDNCNGLTFKLNANLDFSDKEFAGIGTDSTAFVGTFLGDDNYAISNLTTCVFNNIGDGAKVSGLKVYNSTIQKSCGIIVDKMSGGTIENCTVKGGGVAIFAEGSYAGGIVGNGTGGTVSNCNVLDLMLLSSSDNVVVGTGSTTVSDCTFANVKKFLIEDIINTVGGTDGGNNVEYYGLPKGLTAQGDSFTVDGATYYKAGATFTVDANAAGYAKITKINGATANGDGSYTITGNITLEGYPKIDGFTFNDAGNCYEISDAQDLVNLADYVDDRNDCKGLTFKLTNDIDLSAIENFTPIGYVSSSASYPFAGTFDGDNHTISNLTISTSYYQAGLFGYVSGGTVQNVKLFNANVTGGNGTAGNHVGGVVGELTGSGSVTNCTLGGTVNISRSGAGYAGGLVGFLDIDSTIDGVLIDGATISLPDTGGAGAVLGCIYNKQRYTLSNIYYHDFSGTVVNNDDITATTVYALNLPEGVEATGAIEFGGKYFAAEGATVTLTFAEGIDTSKITINGQSINTSDNTYQFTMGGGDTSIMEGGFMTQQEVIKTFVNKLANHGYAYSEDVGIKMLDSAVRASSRFTSIQEVIDAMKADQIAAEKFAVEEVLGSSYAGKTLAEIDETTLATDAKTHAGAIAVGNAFIENYQPDVDVTVEDVIKERKAYIFLEKYCGIKLPTRYWLTKGSQTLYDSSQTDTAGNPLRACW